MSYQKYSARALPTVLAGALAMGLVMASHAVRRTYHSVNNASLAGTCEGCYSSFLMCRKRESMRRYGARSLAISLSILGGIHEAPRPGADSPRLRSASDPSGGPPLGKSAGNQRGNPAITRPVTIGGVLDHPKPMRNSFLSRYRPEIQSIRDRR
jgi:hypothetical protein